MENLTGRVIGNWTVTEGTGRYITCMCVCGTVREMFRYRLLAGKTLSCGCQMVAHQAKTALEKYGTTSHNASPIVKEKKRQACLAHYGYEHPQQVPEVRAKTRATNLERYGVEHVFQSEQIKAKSREAHREHYGVDYPMQVEETRQKSKETSVARYGWPYPTKSLVVQQKTRLTNLERYGYESQFQVPEVQQKAKDAVFAKYGCHNVFQDPGVRRKIGETNLERYGFEFSSQCPEIKEKIRATSEERYGFACTLQSPDVHAKTICTNLTKYGVENVWQSPDIRAKICATNLERYGFECSMHNTDVQQKAWNTRLANPNKYMHSAAELEILHWVRQYYPEAKSSAKGGRQIDILVPELNLAIEYNGLWWHSEMCSLRKGKDYHITKQNILKEHGIRTIFIWEHEWRDRQEQVKNFLMAALKISTHKVGARKCDFREISSTEALSFVDRYHIQSLKQSQKYCLGCFHNGELVAVSTFNKHHRNNEDTVLTRFCCKTGYHIAGCLSKMSKMALDHFKQDLVSWADKMKSAGTGYEAAGWVKEEELKPDYFYISRSDAGNPIPKQARQKRIVHTPEGMTEAEHAVLDGLGRCWDCGKIRYRYKYA